MLLLCALIVGSGSVWAAENDTHDFSQSLSQLLNNNASIPSITIDQQSYPVKEVIVSYSYNKNIENAITIAVSVGGENWGSHVVSKSETSEASFKHEVATGDIIISFTNGTGNGTGHGTFNVTKVRLVEGVSPAFTVTLGDDNTSLTETSGGAGVTLPSRSDIGSYSFVGWSETNVSDETTTTPTIIPVGTYKPTADITLYPVYSKIEGGGGTINKTTSVTISDYASANNWVSSERYTSITMDENVTATGKSNGNNSKYYSSSPGTWRHYGGDSGEITITTTSGTLTNVTITYSGNTLKYGNGDVTSGTAIAVSGASAVFNVSGSSGNTQVSIISVDYTITDPGTTYYWSSPVAATVEKPVITLADNPFLFSTTATITCATEGAFIKYSFDGENWSDYSAALTISSTTTIYAKAIKGEDESTVASVTATKNLAMPTVTVGGDLTVDLDGGTNVSAGTLSAAVTYNDAAVVGASVTWSSSNTNIATINETTGAVTIKSTGEVTFTATYAGNSDYTGATGTKTVNVIDKPTILVEDSEVTFGSTFSVDDKLIEGGDITVTSSNTSVATVSGLVITPVAVGTTTITVSTAANGTYKAGSETFTLTVKAPVGGTTAMTANDVVLFHETFGNNEGSARIWDDSYSVKSGVSDVYSGITSYTVSNVKQGKNTTGSTGSGLNQSSSNTDAYIIIGPLNVADYKNMKLTYQWKAASIGATYSTSASYATSPTGAYSALTGTGTGATTFVERTYSLPEEAQVSTLYLKIVWNTSNTQAIIDEVNLSCPGSATESVTLNGSGYATFCSQYPLDFSDYETADYSAWKITSIENDVITFSQITGSVKGGTGILLKGTADETVAINSSNSTNELSGNKLVGTLAPTYVETNTYYGLSGASFVKVGAGTVPAGKALLPASVVDGAGARLTFVFEDAQGIKTIEHSPLTIDDSVYNLSGQRVTTPKKGLYILNGKKVVMK